MDNPTLDYEPRQGIQEGTDEFGKANLKIIMDFALQHLQQVTLMAAIAHQQKRTDTPVVGGGALVQYINHDLLEKDEHMAWLWMQSWEVVFPRVVKWWLDGTTGAHVDERKNPWLDLDEVIATHSKTA